MSNPAVVAAAQQLNEILNMALSDDNDIRSAADNAFDERLKTEPEGVALGLAHIIAHAEDPTTREVAAVLFRRNTHSFLGETRCFFQRCSPAVQAELKQSLLMTISSDIKGDRVRSKVADCIAGIVKCILILIDQENEKAGAEPAAIPSAEVYWPELLQKLWELAQSGSPQHLISALEVFAGIPGLFGGDIDKYAQPIKQLMTSGLTSSDKEVRVAAAKAYAAFIVAVKRDIVLFLADLTPQIIQLTGECLEAGETEAASDVLQAMIEMVEKQPKSLKPYLGAIVQTMLSIMNNEEVDEDCRKLSLEVVASLCDNAPRLMRKVPEFAQQYIFTLFKLLTEVEEDAEWTTRDTLESDDEGEDTAVAAEYALDRLAQALGAKSVLPTAFELLPGMVQNANWKIRHAACVAISNIGEGCRKTMQKHLDAIVDQVLPLLLDPVHRVRYAATKAFGQMALDFAAQDAREIPISFESRYHDKVIPALFGAVKNSEGHPRVQANAINALVFFCDNMTKELMMPYLDTILMELSQLMGNPFIIVQEESISALATIADAAESHFERYYDAFMPHMKTIIREAGAKEHRMLRAKTFECATLMGVAVGRDRFRPDAVELIQVLCSAQDAGLAPDDPQATYMLSCWARLCQALKSEFLPYMQYIMPGLLAAAKQPPGIRALEAGEELDDVPENEQWEVMAIDDERIGIKTSSLEEKKCACEVLMLFAKELKGDFAPYVKDVLEFVPKHLRFYFEEGVRVSAAEIVSHLLTAYLENPQFGPEAALQLWAGIYEGLIGCTKEEPELEVLGCQLAALVECFEVLKEGALNENVLQLTTSLIDEVLAEYEERCKIRIEAQQSDEDYDEAEEENVSEEVAMENEITREVTGVLHCLFGYSQTLQKSGALPNGYFDYFGTISERVINLLDPHRHFYDLRWGLCIIDDLLEYCGPASTAYAAHFAETMVHSLSSRHYEVRQAAAYGIGQMADKAAAPYKEVIQAALQPLLAMVEAPGSREAPNTDPTENAIDALLYIALTGTAGISEADLLPKLAEWLPITSDDEVAEHIYGYLCDRIEQQSPLLTSELVVKFLLAMSAVVGLEVLPVGPESVGSRCLALIRAIMGQMEDVRGVLIARWQEDASVNERMAGLLSAAPAASSA